MLGQLIYAGTKARSSDEITNVNVGGKRIQALSSGLSMNMYDGKCSSWSQNEYFQIAVANLIRHLEAANQKQTVFSWNKYT